ncbi:MAG: serine hydrolase domain-containing protein [Chitinophagaceae bacterium]
MRALQFDRVILFFVVAIAMSSCKHIPAANESLPDGFLKEDIKTVDSLAGAFMVKYNVPGLSFTISQSDSIKIERCYGYADKGNNKLMAPGNRFRIASISKPFTATAIMQLIEQSKLHLQDKVFGKGMVLDTIYGSYPYKKWVEDITIEMLLEHLAGGWGNDENDPMFAHPEMNQAKLIGWTLDSVPLQHEPGTHYQYSNFGFCVLGRVIEKITGMKYEDYVHQNILQPCNITDMQVGGNTLSEQLPGEVQYYDKQEDPYAMNVSRMDSHGGWIATPTDLVKFVMRVDKFPQKPDILKQATLDTMFSAPSVNSGYAKGWSVNKQDNYFHGGGLPGLVSILVRAHDGFCWAAIVNTRAEGDFSLDLDHLMWNIRKAIKQWPDIEVK